MNNTRGSKVLTNSIVYSIGGLITKGFAFFLLPLYTAYLTPADYGITSIVTTFLSISGFIVSFSLFASVLRFYVDYKDTPESLRVFYGTTFIFITVAGLFFWILLYLLRDVLSYYIFAGIDFYPIVCVCLISMVFNCTHTFFETILRSQQKAMKATILSVAYFLLNAGFTILLVVFFDMGALGVVLATLIAGFSYTIYMLLDMIFHGTIAFRFDGSILKESLKYSIPIIPHNISPHLALLVEKVLISGRCSLAVLGIYSVAAQFGSLADTVQIYVNQAYGPWLFEKIKENKGPSQEIRNISKLLAAVIGGIFLIISIFAHDYIILFIDPQYVDAWMYVPLIVIVYTIKTTYYFYVNILFYYKKAARILFLATLAGSLSSVCLAFCLIPQIGANGAIVADGIAMIIQVALVIYISKKFDDIGLKLRDFISNIIMVSSFVFIGLLPSFLYFGHEFNLANMAYKILITILYCIVVFYQYRKKIQAIVYQVKNKLIKQ